MKKQLGTILLCGALLASSTVAMAQPHDGHRSHHRQHSHHRYGPPHKGHPGMHDRGRHEGWYHRGGYVPRAYRGPTYVVSDWRVHHLRPPPRGYHWVRGDSGDFLLVAITTGIIASIIASGY